jgi:uncharacterized membrane protein
VQGPLGGGFVSNLLVALVTFLCLLAAAFGGLFGNTKLRSRHLQDDTNATVRLVANIFVVMTSLALGLMMNAANTTFQTNERNVHALATELIRLDRAMKAFGPLGDQAREHLIAYVRLSLDDPNIVDRNPRAEALLESVGASLREIRPANDDERALWNDARQIYRQAVRQRWIVVDAVRGTIPAPVIIIVVSWLVFIFASFGYRAPRNAVTIVSLVLGAFLMSANLALILDMDVPTGKGLIQVSNQPFQRALAEMQR